MKNPFKFEFLQDITRLKNEVYEDGEFTPAWARDTVYERLDTIEETMEALLDKLGVHVSYKLNSEFFGEDIMEIVIKDNEIVKVPKVKKTSSAKTSSAKTKKSK